VCPFSLIGRKVWICLQSDCVLWDEVVGACSVRAFLVNLPDALERVGSRLDDLIAQLERR